MLKVGGNTDKGIRRENNQDVFYISDDPSMPIYILADGMGGHKAGELASNMASEIIVERIIKDKDKLNSEKSVMKWIKKTIEEANTKIYLESRKNKEYMGMGTTIIIGYIYKDKFYLGHVGDSRAYVIRDEKMEQITEDHSYVNQLLKLGNITKEEARNHPKKNMITRAVGSSSIIEIDLIDRQYKKGDILVLCSDGLYNMVEDSQILEAFKNNKMQKACDKLISIANDNGGIDNITVLAIKFECSEVRV